MPFAFERISANKYGHIPGGIYDPRDIPQVGEKVIILSFLEIIDDGAYEIIEKDIERSQKHYLLVKALTYTPGRAAHADWAGETALFSYQTLRIVPVIFNAKCPFYATLPLEMYQYLCEEGTYEPKGKGGRDALRLRP